MKLTRYLLFSTMALVVCLVSSAFAQGGGGARRFYDPSTETTINGKIDKVTEVPGKHGWNGIHLTVRTDKQTYEVHVGPSDYVSNNGFTFSGGDQIEVTGSEMMLGGTDTIIAREIKKNDKVLALRDSKGIPMWSGGRRRY